MTEDTGTPQWVQTQNDRATNAQPIRDGQRADGEVLAAPEGCLIVEPIDAPTVNAKYAFTPEEAKRTGKILLDPKVTRLACKNIGWITAVGPTPVMESGREYPARWHVGDWIVWSPGRQVELPDEEHGERRTRILIPVASVLALVLDPTRFDSGAGPREVSMPQASIPLAIPGGVAGPPLRRAAQLVERTGH